MQIKLFMFFVFMLLYQTFVCAQEVKDSFPPASMTGLMDSDANGIVIRLNYDENGWFRPYSSQPLEKTRNVSIDIQPAHPESDSNATVGTEGIFLNGKKEGIWRKTIAYNVLREETYHDNVLHGISRVFSRNGKLLFQTFFENGTGYYIDYYSEYHNDNVQVFVKGNLIHGKRDGLWIAYFKNGRIMFEENYKNGLLQGKRTTYFESGQIQVEEHYKDNLLHGTRTSYDKEGNVLYTTQFTNGTGLYKLYKLKYKGEIEVEEGPLEDGYRVGKWMRIFYEYYEVFGEIKMDIRYKSYNKYTTESPENTHLTHKLTETVYDNGHIYHLYADNPE